MTSTRPPERSWRRDPTTERWWGDPSVWGLLLAAAVLWLPHLDSSGLLWQDEAETAALAQNVLRFGYPKVFDGVNRINPGLSAGPWDVWAYHPWLSIYLAAGVFAVFGETTATARLPFALLGVVSVALAYRLALQVTAHRRVAQLTGLLTLLSIPLILHARQCRYYAPAILATLWVLWAYAAARDGRRGAWWWLTAGLLILFHSHHGAFLPTTIALGLHAWRWGLPAAQRPAAIRTVGLVAAGMVPWLWILDVGQHHGTWSFKELRHHAQFYIRQVNRFVVPLGFLAAAWACRAIRPIAWWRAATARQRETMGIIVLVVAVNFAFVIAVPWQRHFRYLIHLLPLLYLGEAIVLWGWLRRRPRWLAVLAAVLISTDLLHYSAPYAIAQAIPSLRQRIAHAHGLVSPQSLLWAYSEELTHRYRGPLEGIVEILQSRARPGETAKIPYDDHAVIFYTGLKVEDLNRFSEETFPDWIIPRRDWVPSAFYTSAYFLAIEQRYERIETDAPDLMWENRPDPGTHQFRTVTNVPRQVLYHRKPVKGEG